MAFGLCYHLHQSALILSNSREFLQQGHGVLLSNHVFQHCLATIFMYGDRAHFHIHPFLYSPLYNITGCSLFQEDYQIDVVKRELEHWDNRVTVLKVKKKKTVYAMQILVSIFKYDTVGVTFGLIVKVTTPTLECLYFHILTPAAHECKSWGGSNR